MRSAWAKVVCVVALFCGGPAVRAGAARLFLVPQGADAGAFGNGPTVVTLESGGSRTFDVFVADTAPRALAGVQIVLWNASGGSEGSVMYVADSVLVDDSREDYPFAEPGGGCPPPPPVILCAVTGSPLVIGEPRYVGELAYRASADACGVFAVEFIEAGTLLLDDRGLSISYVGQPLLIEVTTAGDANRDGVVDLGDFEEIATCHTGPGGGPGFPGLVDECACADFDNDGYVDLLEFGVLQWRFGDGG